MKKESNVAYILRLALTLLIICAVVAGLLSGVNAITKHPQHSPRIHK
jgi:Na+-translocating ferredoxin:NAD+ oxidoreductase RnfG subunit